MWAVRWRWRVRPAGIDPCLQRSGLPSSERRFRSRIAQLASSQWFLRGTLSECFRKCGSRTAAVAKTSPLPWGAPSLASGENRRTLTGLLGGLRAHPPYWPASARSVCTFQCGGGAGSAATAEKAARSRIKKSTENDLITLLIKLRLQNKVTRKRHRS